MTAKDVALLSSAVEAHGQCWSESVQAQLSSYQSLLRDRGGRVNLVSRRDLFRLVEAHFVDCLRPLPYLPPSQGARVLDLGSGAGLPGVILKIFRPDIALFLVESSRKKSLFLQHVVRELHFQAASVLNVRVEDLAGDGGYSQSMEVVTSRAVASLGQTAEWALPLLRDGGSLVVFKPHDPSQEISSARQRGQLRGFTDPVILPEAQASAPRGCLLKLVKEPNP